MAARNNNTKMVTFKDEEQIMDLLPSPGYRFVPTDQELIRYYLRPKIANRKLPRWNVISDRDLYGDEEPAEIFEGRAANEMYFFTPIKKKYQKGKNIDRLIMGKGAWKAQSTKEVYDEGKKLMGFKTSLNFVSTKTPGKTISWIMHEYTLCEDQSLALCRIKRGRGNTTAGGGGGGSGDAVGGLGVSPPRLLTGEEDEENVKLAAMAALYKMSTRSSLKKKMMAGDIQPVEVQQVSDGVGNDDLASDEASESEDDDHPEDNAPTSNGKGKVGFDDSDYEHNYTGSPKRYKRRTTDAVKNNMATKTSNVPTTRADTATDNSHFAVPSRTREPLTPNSVAEPTFDIVNVDHNRDIVSKDDSTFKSSKVPLPHLRNDAHDINAHNINEFSPEDLMQVIMDANDKIQLAGISFTSKYRFLEEQYKNLQGRYAELESELAQMKKELSDKDRVISERHWENKTLLDVLKKEKASFKRKLDDMQAYSGKMADNLSADLHKGKKTRFSKLSDLSPQSGPSDNAPFQIPE